MMKILHLVDSGGMYGKEKVVMSLLKLKFATSLVCNVSNRSEFISNVDPGQRVDWDSVDFSDYDIVHCHDFKSSVLGWFKYFRTKNSRPRFIRTLHGYTVTKRLSKKNLYRFIDKFLLMFFDSVIRVAGDLPGTIKNGIEKPMIIEKEFSDDIIEFCETGLVIGSVGRLSPEKNYSTLIKAIGLAKNPRVKLIILGEGPQRPELEKLIRDNHLEDRVMLPGFVTQPETWYRLFDYYIQPSLTEGTPIAVLESAAIGKPMLLTSVGGMTDFVDNAVVIPIPTTEEMHTVIDDVANKSRVKRSNTIRRKQRVGGRRASDRAYVLWMKYYTEESMLNSHQQLYESL